jgi:SNF2 family DNA or RNA helicase/uncharacterized membrane protein YkvA (DUF1232 family)
MIDSLIPKNLVLWRQAGGTSLGTVIAVEAKRATVRFDNDSEPRHFSLPSEVLERASLESGQHVRLLADDQTGVIQASLNYKGLLLYKVGLPGGATKTVPEDGVRPAVITDPVERLRSGPLHSARRTNLRVAATRLLYAYQHDELSTLGNSRVELKPHQIGVVHRVANGYPHRFILADEVGLGKTIEAGLIMRELLARGVTRRILVLAPSGLVGQWQQELKTKFNLPFALYNRESLKWMENKHPGENPWTIEHAVITSTSFATVSTERHKQIADAGWDMIVIDEAHHARRTRQAGNRSSSTRLYRLAEQLSDPELTAGQAMLLLTATPMQLDPHELYSLIELLDPPLFPTEADFNAHRKELRGLNETVEKLQRWPTLNVGEREQVLVASEGWLGVDEQQLARRAETDNQALVSELAGQHRLSRVMVRNRKRVVGGFMPRVAAIWPVELTDDERSAHDAVERYLRTGYARSKAVKNNTLGFLMSTFQKMNASSSYTLKRSLERRIDKLEGVTREGHRAAILDEADLEELPTADALDDLLATRVDLDWAEVLELEKIVEQLDALGTDSKARVLLENLEQIAESDPQAKVIIFTQFLDTQTYIASLIDQRWSVNLFRGGRKPQEKDAAVAAFRDGVGLQILLSTEAGGEGRNFQFCHILINYDLPWNPMKVEQRIGRVDRIGQTKPVKIFNFSTLGTIEERVVDVLTRRIGVFKETIGGLDPILGEVESDLNKIFLAADREAEVELRALSERLESRIADARVAEDQRADLIMDTSSYRRSDVELLLQRPAPVKPRDMQSFVLGTLSELNVRITKDQVHDGIYRLHFSNAFERLFPDELASDRERDVTFDLSVALEREEVEYLAFGHSIVDGLVDVVRRSELGGIASYRTVLSDEVEPARGWFFVYEVELHGMATERGLLPVFVNEGGALNEETASWLLDRAMTNRREDFPESSALPPRAEAFEAAVDVAEGAAVMHLLERQRAMEATNASRLADERCKQERFFDYRAQAAADKLTVTRHTLERLRESHQSDDQRILPVWEKNARNAADALAAVEVERERRLGELDGKEQVGAQHELLSASFVSIELDPAPLFAQVEAALTPAMNQVFMKLCRRTTVEQLSVRRDDVLKRRLQLLAHAKRGHAFDAPLAVGVAEALAHALQELDRFSPRELNVLSGAVEYFLELDDESPDLKSSRGFADDRQVANIVLEAIGRPELCVRAAHEAAAD